jgi:phage-related protein
MSRKALRTISWLKGALKDFQKLPEAVRDDAADALTEIAEGNTPDVAKPMTGLGAGVWELVIKERGDAFRVIYALQLDDDIWVVHAFQKKSKSGIATPKQEIDLVRERIKRLKEALR